LNVEIGPEWLRRLLNFGGALDQPLEFCGDRVSEAGRLLLTEFDRATDVADRDGALAIESLTWEILAEAVDRGGAHGAGKDRPRWVERARELVEHSGVGSPGLAQIAAEVGVHPVHLAATFRRFYGCSIGEYSRRRRLEHARRLLADRSSSLAQVAVQAGFADQSHLTRAFRRHAGVTPARYRTFLPFKTR
jgi:AraC family transcriptional regulator